MVSQCILRLKGQIIGFDPSHMKFSEIVCCKLDSYLRKCIIFLCQKIKIIIMIIIIIIMCFIYNVPVFMALNCLSLINVNMILETPSRPMVYGSKSSYK